MASAAGDEVALAGGCDLEDSHHPDSAVYTTFYHRVWEQRYMRKLAGRMHNLLCTELSKEEETLLMLFMSFDANLDGVLVGEEANGLLLALQQGAAEVGEAGGLELEGAAGWLLDADGSISFVSLLRWYSGGATLKHQDTKVGFNLASIAVGLLGSNILHNNGRLDELDWKQLRRNIVGYRVLLLNVLAFNEERMLLQARQEELAGSIEKAMPLFHAALTSEFTGDMAYLFELFCRADHGDRLALEVPQAFVRQDRPFHRLPLSLSQCTPLCGSAAVVEELLRFIDPSASHDELVVYISELDLQGAPLSFASLLDWWQQAWGQPRSLIVEKGIGMLAKVRANAAWMQVSGLFASSSAKLQWSRAAEKGTLSELRWAYCRTLGELREWKLKQASERAEIECVEL